MGREMECDLRCEMKCEIKRDKKIDRLAKGAMANRNRVVVEG
jgi:hypothetical protein